MTQLLNDFLSGSAAWGVLLTLAAFALGTLINKVTGKAIFNPLLLGSIFVIIFLSVCKIPYADYKASAAPVNYLLLPATVALACQRATDEELAQIRQKAERMERIAKAGGDWPLADQEFHMAIIKASHNEYMRRLYPIINGAVNEILQVSVNRAHMQSIAIADNYMILDFLMQRDEAGARHAMSIHIRHLLNTLKG